MNQSDEVKWKLNISFRKRYILFFVLFFVLFIYSVSQVALLAGDKFVETDHIGRADFLYKVGRVSNPLDSRFIKRLEITRALLGSWKVENTIGDPIIDNQSNNDTISVPILTYHYIRSNPFNDDKFLASLSVSPSDFKNQMDYLVAQGYQSITLDDLNGILTRGLTPPEKPIIITFDDGYENQYTNAYPILKSYGLKAEAFVITDFIDEPNYLTWQQIDEMKKSGVFSFESHTVDHAILTLLTNEHILDELKNSKVILERHLGNPINWVAYPYGQLNQNTVKLALEAGYTGGVDNMTGTKVSSHTMYSVPRITVAGGESLESFASNLSQNY